MIKNTILNIIGFFLLSFFSTHNLLAFEDGDIILSAYGTYFHQQTNSHRAFNTIPGSVTKFEDTGGGMVSLRYTFLTYLGIEASSAIARETIKGEGTLDDVSIGSAWYMPSTLMAQYYFNPCAKCQFHLGAGGHYSFYFDTFCKIDDTHLNLDNRRFGLAAQIGMDYQMTESCFFSMDAKYLRLYNEVKLVGATSGHVNLKLNPWLISIGFAKRY